MAFKDREVKDFEFTVYDPETGVPVDGDFAITHYGELIVYLNEMAMHVSVEKGKYIIRFTDGRYMRY